MWTSNLGHDPDSKVHGAIMGPTWGRQDPGGPHVGPMNLAIRVKWWQRPHQGQHDLLNAKMSSYRYHEFPSYLYNGIPNCLERWHHTEIGPSLKHVLGLFTNSDQVNQHSIYDKWQVETVFALKFLSLYTLKFSEEQKHIFTWYVIAPHWHDTGGWNPFSSKTKIYKFYIVNSWCPGKARS